MSDAEDDGQDAGDGGESALADSSYAYKHLFSLKIPFSGVPKRQKGGKISPPPPPSLPFSYRLHTCSLEIGKHQG